VANRKTRADCTVRAFALVAGVGYELAESIAADAGRKPGRGFKSEKLIAEAKALGYSFRKVRMGSRSLAKFLREHPAGRFFARKRGHAFAVIDGATNDKRVTPHSIILDAWEFAAESAA
jgi:hypothetical protein